MADDLTVSHVIGATTGAGWHLTADDDLPPALRGAAAAAPAENEEGGDEGGAGGALTSGLSRSRLDEGKLAWMVRSGYLPLTGLAHTHTHPIIRQQLFVPELPVSQQLWSVNCSCVGGGCCWLWLQLRRFPTPEGMDPGAWEAILKHTISPRRWIDDTARAECTGCGCGFAAVSWSSFALMGGSGKHHCRICGDVFCDTCAPVRERITLPGFIAVIDVPDSVTAGAAGVASAGVGALASAVGWEDGGAGYRRYATQPPPLLQLACHC